MALAGLVGNDHAIGEAFHITSDEVLTWNKIVSEIAMAVGADVPTVHKIPTDLICRIAPQALAEICTEQTAALAQPSTEPTGS